jgi:lyso-ornithine lipid O-acyltransferase
MPRLRAFAILAAFLILTLGSIPWQLYSLHFRLKRRKTFPTRFHRILAKLFGLRITVIGTPVKDCGVLMVANHTGYLDILILSATVPVSFVAKSEVKSWPLFGLMAQLQESVFVERGRRIQAGEARHELRERLRAGDALVLFPEGTSTDGNRVLAFKSSLLGAAESDVGVDDTGHRRMVPVQPVSISYVGMHGMPMGRENRPLYAWYGDMELLPHLWESLVAGPMDVVVEFHDPLTADGVGGRKKLAQLAEQTVRRGQVCALNGSGVQAEKRAASGEKAVAEAAA